MRLSKIKVGKLTELKFSKVKVKMNIKRDLRSRLLIEEKLFFKGIIN